MISFLHCFNIIKAPKRAYLISGSILIILNDGVFVMDLNNTVLTGKKLRGAEKMARIPIKVVPTETTPKKPEWIRTKISQPEKVQIIKDLLRQQKLHTVCHNALAEGLQRL
jgi:lipoyl synthase